MVVYGSRGKIGLIQPAPGYNPEEEFHRMSPDGIAVVTMHIPLETATPESIAKFTDKIVSHKE